MDMLAVVAIPQGVLSPLLPPFASETCERRIRLDVLLFVRARAWNCREAYAVVVHGARKECVTCLTFVCDSACCGAILVDQLLRRRVLVKVVLTSQLAR